MAPRTGRLAEPTVEECQEPIAVIGMGCRWPGGIESPSDLWEFLINKKSGHSERVPLSRFNIDAHYHFNLERPGSFNVLGGYFLSGDLRDFDPSMFGISPVEAMWLDPQQRKLLEVVYECLESAGLNMKDISGTQTGCFVGSFTNDYQQISMKEQDFRHSYAATGVDPGLISNRVSHVFNLRGPSMTINTACSSSVYALHQACNALRAGDCGAAIVGGTNLILTVDQHMNTAKLGVLSPTSQCHTFNAHADGYGRGEGVGALYLKRLSDALRDGDPIRAVIRGSAVNSNGKVIGAGITHPSMEGQINVIKEAYRLSGGLNPLLTGYFECHGTGTAVGDPLEVEALAKAMAPGRTDPLIIGAVKASIGHCEAASGIAAIMKAVLAVEKGLIPPTYGFTNPNPKIKWSEWNVVVNTETIPWPEQLPIRRASVNSFGYGGTNAHVIIEAVESVAPRYRKRRGGMNVDVLDREDASYYIVSHIDHIDEGYRSGREVGHERRVDGARAARHISHTSASANGDNHLCPPSQLFVPVNNRDHDFRVLDDLLDLTDSDESSNPEAVPSKRSQFVLPFSAHESDTLRLNIKQIAAVVHQYELLDLAYTLAGRRSLLDKRAFAVVNTSSVKTDLEDDALLFGDAKDALLAQAAFIFTGQGAQWPRMGSTLMAEFPSFHQTIQQLDSILGRLYDAPSWTLEGALLAPAKESRVYEVALSQPLCTAIQIGLVNLLESWSVTPVAVVGHSSGEIAAAYCAGLISASEAIIIAYYRGKVVSENTKRGAMLAVGLGALDVAKYLTGIEEQVVVACENSSTSVTLSGDSEGIAEVAARLENGNVFNRRLMTDGRAYHSHHMRPCAIPYENFVAMALKRLGIVQSRLPRARKARMISSVTGEEVNEIDSGYWSRNLTGSVLFDTALKQLLDLETSLTHLLEIGPHGALGGPTRQTLKDRGANITYESTLTRNSDGVECLLRLAGKLFLKNYPVDLVRANSTEYVTSSETIAEHGQLLVDLPRYQWNYKKRFWAENRPSQEQRTSKRGRHDILGRKIYGASEMEPVWRNILRQKDLPWLKDHQIGPDTIFPGAGHWAMAIEAITQINEDSSDVRSIWGFKLRDIIIKTALVIPDNDDGVEVILNIRKSDSQDGLAWYSFSIKSVGQQNWTEHSSGKIAILSQDAAIKKKSTKSLRHSSTGNRWYKAFRGIGFNYGPSFQGLDNIKTDPSYMDATGTIPIRSESRTMKGESRYALHPSTIDNCLQLALISIYSGRISAMSTGFVPVKADEITIQLPRATDVEGRAGEGYARTMVKGVRSAQCFVQLSEGNDVLLDIDGLRVIAYEAAMPHITQDVVSQPYWQSSWVPDLESWQGTWSASAAFLNINSWEKFKAAVEILILKRPDTKTLQIHTGQQTGSRWFELSCSPYINRRIVMGFEFSEAMEASFNQDGPEKIEKVLLDELIQNGATFDLVLCPNLINEDWLEKISYLLGKGAKVLAVNVGSFPETVFEKNQLKLLIQETDDEGTSLLLFERFQEDVGNDAQQRREVLIVHYDASLGATERLYSACVSRGYSTRIIPLEEYAETNSLDVILLLDEKRPFLINMNASLLQQLKLVLSTAASAIWITHGCLYEGYRPEDAMVFGFRRSLIAERASLNLKVIDLDAIDDASCNIVLSQLENPTEEGELLVTNGVLYVNRVVPHKDLNDIHQALVHKGAEELVFNGQKLKSIVTGGPHPAIQFVKTESAEHGLPAGCVEVFIKASGVNYEDIQVLMGSVDNINIRREFSGVVTKVADDVSGLHVGDSVCAICIDGFSTYQIVPATLCQRISAVSQIDFERSAAVPIAYTTAYYALVILARVELDDRILITTDTGYPGQMAISLAQSIGAQVYVTATSSEEVDYFSNTYGLPESHILAIHGKNSTEADITALTKPCRFDVILTGGSLYLEELWRYIASGGRLVHIGGTNMANLDATPFSHGCTFTSIDIPMLFQHKQKQLANIWQKAYNVCSELITLIEPTAFPLSKLHQAITSCSNSIFAKKHVVTCREGDTVLSRAKEDEPIFDEDVSYLLVGCLGGLGRSLTTWMIKRGARHLVFLSRTGADKPEAASLIAYIERQGVTATVVRGDVSSSHDVLRARYSVPPSRPIRGIVHAATVFKDALFDTMNIDGFARSFQAKVDGARNLHEAFLDQQLDFFIMTSSISATLGTPGQTNYAAGNSYLDYLARHRQALGLPATSLILPMILGIGYVSERPEVEEGLLRKGLYGIDEDELLMAFELAIKGSSQKHSEIIVGVDPARLAKALQEGTTSDPYWFNDPRLSGVKTAITGSSNTTSRGGASHGKIVDRLRQDFGTTGPKELVEAATGYVIEKLSRMMFIPLEEISPSKSVQYYGVDSSIGTELRNWLFAEFKVDLSIQTMLSPNISIMSLAEHLCVKNGLLDGK